MWRTAGRSDRFQRAASPERRCQPGSGIPTRPRRASGSSQLPGQWREMRYPLHFLQVELVFMLLVGRCALANHGDQVVEDGNVECRHPQCNRNLRYPDGDWDIAVGHLLEDVGLPHHMPTIESHVAGEPEPENKYDQFLPESRPCRPLLDNQSDADMAAVMKGIGKSEEGGGGKSPAGHVFR